MEHDQFLAYRNKYLREYHVLTIKLLHIRLKCKAQLRPDQAVNKPNGFI